MHCVKAVLLAAGEGKRMKSEGPKVLHKVNGVPMIQRVLNACPKGAEPIVVVGHKKEMLTAYLETHAPQAQTVEQAEQKGTGHAVLQAAPLLQNYPGKTLVLAGDMPLLTRETLETLVERTPNGGAALLVSTMENPTGYGRILRDASGQVARIIEEKDADEAQKQVREVNASVYCFDTPALLSALSQLSCDNAQGEYYLTDCVEIFRNQERQVAAVPAGEKECMGVNDRTQLWQAEQYIQQQVCQKHMENGVTLLDPQHVYIEESVVIGKDTEIYPGAMLAGGTVLGERCVIMGSTRLVDSVIGDDVEIINSVILQSSVGEGTTVGPFSYIRPNCTVGRHCKVGDFVEVKNATVGDGTKLPHLAYIGDADVGKDCNIACGTIFVNYDGKLKHRSKVEDHCFIGCNVNLVAPVNVRQGAYVAAGTTITEEVPEGALAIGRTRAVIKTNWAEDRRRQGKLK